MTKAVGISKKEQNRRDELMNNMREAILESKANWDPAYAFDDYYEKGITLEELIISAIYRLDFLIGNELDKLREAIFDVKKELQNLIKEHKHTKDGSAYRPIEGVYTS